MTFADNAVPFQDLSWRNAGSQLAKYLTNNLHEEPWKRKFEKKNEDPTIC
jgi:hypothetical protein